MTTRKVTEKQKCDRLIQVIKRIQSDPNPWNQYKWHCVTTHCFAGHADILAGNKQMQIPKKYEYKNIADYNKADDLYYIWLKDTPIRASAWLGLTEEELDQTRLFSSSASFYSLYLTVISLINKLKISGIDKYSTPNDFPDINNFINK